MTVPFLIVTGGDARFFPLLHGCVSSLRDTRQGRDVPLGVFDFGLAPDQISWLKQVGARIVVPGWDIAIPSLDSPPEYYKALTARPFLPKYFPDAETLFWLDADAWVQDWSAVLLFRRAASDGSLACVPEIDRSYRNFFHAWAEFHGVIHNAYRAAFGEPLASEMVHHPLINSGAFALRAGSPTWEVWAGLVAQGLANTDNFLTEQSALNLAVYRHEVKKHFLPTWCNWAAHHATPAWDTARHCFVEPYLPHQKIGILHLTVWTKNEPTVGVHQIGGPEDGTLKPMSLRYPGGAG